MQVESVAGLDTAVFEVVLEEGTTAARITLARQLTLLVASEDTPPLEREQVIPVLLKLAVDPVRQVRAVLFEELESVQGLNSDLLFSMVAAEDDLALPFLSRTPSLNNWHMMAVLRVGDEARQITIARRLDISAEAATYIIRSLALPVVLAAMDNVAVQLEVSDLHALYGRFGHSETLIERLLALPNLPPDIRILQAKRAATRMRQLMAERGWMPANEASELVADSEESAILQVLAEASGDEIVATTAFLAGKQMLTPSLIIRAACLGELRVVEATLAHLSGLTPQRAAASIYAKGGSGMRATISKAGISSSFAGVLIAFAEVTVEAREEEVVLSREHFGRRLLEALMTRYDGMAASERARQIAYVGKFGDDKVRKIARQLKVDLQRAA